MAKAWLITWDGPKTQDWNQSKKIAAILKPSLSIDTVKQFVERLYASRKYPPKEQFEYTRQSNENPYKAKNERGRIYCGHSPSLYGRIVEDVKVKTEEEISWEEPDVPEDPLA